MFQEIFIVEDNGTFTKEIKEIFARERDFRFRQIKTEEMRSALSNIPSLIVINEDSIQKDIIEVCQQVREDDDNSITPLMVVSSNEKKEHKLKILGMAVEYYMEYPKEQEYIYCNVKNILRLIHSNRTISPLTGLPGNVQIHAEIKKRFLNKEKFTVLYFDLDNFKAYNDVYGFLKGDELIKFTAGVILKHVHNSEGDGDCFTGHIGGDDFVAILGDNDAEKTCQNIIAEFDAGVSQYFYEEDIERGYLEVANRKNVVEQFPIVSISIGMVEADPGRFHNILELGEIGAQVKHLAKTIMGSSYVIDRRVGGEKDEK